MYRPAEQEEINQTRERYIMKKKPFVTLDKLKEIVSTVSDTISSLR